jgi:pimeloyl-ACP methyl ester carboxylesterase
MTMTSGTVPLYFESTGSEDFPTIVFLHGGGAAGWMWRKQVQSLSNRYHCLVPDLPEQGQSVNSGPYTMERAVDLVAELILTQAHGKRAHVVGLSEGAQVVVALLSRHPDVVDHAMISSAILRPLPGSSMYTAGLIKLMHRWFMEPLKNNDWWIRLNMHYAAGIPEEFYKEFKRSFQSTTEDGLTNMMLANLRFRLPPGLEQVKTPVLVVTGSKEYSQMKESARDLLKVLPNSRGITIDLGSKSTLAQEHNWALSASELFTQTLAAFIENRELPSGLKEFV